MSLRSGISQTDHQTYRLKESWFQDVVTGVRGRPRPRGGPRAVNTTLQKGLRTVLFALESAPPIPGIERMRGEMMLAPDGAVPPLYATENHSHIQAPPLPRPSSTEAIKRALDQFTQLTGNRPESLTGMKPTAEGGWSILVDVLELERIPDSTSVMAIYRIDLDPAGQMLACERLRKYHRGDTDGA